MSLNIYKPVDSQQHISILIPTRGRPQYLKNLLDSIEETTENKSLVDAWIYVDDDDVITKQFIDTYQKDRYSFKINYALGGRTISQGEMCNVLREKCTTNPGIYMFGGDKNLFLTKNWDKIVRETFDNYPDRILFAHPVDSYHDHEFGAYGFVSAEWTNRVGRLLTEYFPFWSDDTWINQVAMMVQRRIKLDMRLGLQGGKGKTKRMKNLLFWQRFFNNTMDERIEDANKLRKAIYPEKSPEYDKSVEEGNKLAKRFINRYKKIRDEDLVYMEKHLSEVPENTKSRQDPSYLIAERNAVNHLYKKLGPLVKQGRIIDAFNILDNILFASPVIKGIQYSRIIWQGRFRMVYRALRNPTKYLEYAKQISRFLFGRG